IISGSDDKNLINQCFTKGAYDFIGKTQKWHIKILSLLRQIDEMKRGPVPEIKTTCEDEENKIASIKIKNIFKAGVIDDLKRESLNLILSGFCNLILDLENINTSKTEILDIIVYIFKSCKHYKGSLKLCNVTTKVNKSISFVFLDGIIPICENKNMALKDFYKVNNKT
ncbi:MAG: hypothetical protein KAQ92_01210, partial [Candidatus Aenigmarchaeota archaeon]|nr:hypothetical protein [Candidatus Aenigmarchaeota archaeon]